MSRLGSDDIGPKSERGLMQAGPSAARREAFQPSLWDRLINDLPGVETELDALRSLVGKEIGVEKVETLLNGSVRTIDQDAELSSDQKTRMHQLAFQYRRRAELQHLGVTVSNRVLREAVRRDIEALFNTERYESTPLLSDWEADHFSSAVHDLADFPEVRRSVVNYGVPSFSGRSSRDFDRETLAKEIRTILNTYEPRLKEGATKVDVTIGDKGVGLRIEIDAVLVTNPTPERLRLRTTINLDNGKARTEVRDI